MDPVLLERADDVWETHRGWSNSQLHCPEPPSTYYYRQVHSCFFKDAVGVEMLHRVGIDNIMFETDYPHQDSTWPHSMQAAAEQFGHLERRPDPQDRPRQRHPTARLEPRMTSAPTALLIGGTGPTGPPIALGLRQRGYDVTLLHSGRHELPEVAESAGFRHLHGDVYSEDGLRAAR